MEGGRLLKGRAPDAPSLIEMGKKTSEERGSPECLQVAEKEETAASTGEGDVKAAGVADKAGGAMVVGANEGDDDEVGFSALEGVDGVHLHS